MINPYKPPATASYLRNSATPFQRCLRIITGILLFIAVFMTLAPIIGALLFEFVFGDDYSQFLWVTFPISAMIASIPSAWYARRLARGAGTVFILVIAVSSILWQLAIAVVLFADRILNL